MDKIKGRTHEYRMVMGNLESCWRYCSKEEADEKRRNPKIDGLAGAMYEVRELYTREALEAVAEAVKAQCMEDAAAWSMSFVQVDNAPHGIDDELRKYVDTAAIINQLTGE